MKTEALGPPFYNVGVEGSWLYPLRKDDKHVLRCGEANGEEYFVTDVRFLYDRLNECVRYQKIYRGFDKNDEELRHCHVWHIAKGIWLPGFMFDQKDMHEALESESRQLKALTRDKRKWLSSGFTICDKFYGEE